MRVKLVILVIFVSSVVTLEHSKRVCKYGNGHKLTQMICSNSFVDPEWVTGLNLEPNLEKLVFRNITGSLDLFNLTLPHLKYLLITHSSIENINLGQFPNLVFLTFWKNQKLPNLTHDLFLPATHINWVSLVSNNHTIVPNSLHPLKNLTWLHIQNQKLEHLTGEFFKESEKLHELSVRNCHLGRVDVDAFSNTPDLEILSMNFNKIQFFEIGTFNHLKKLNILELHHNKFSNFNLNQFHGLVSIQVLGLPSNFLKHINIKDLLTTFPNLTKMEIKKKDLIGGNNITNLIKHFRREGINVIGTPHDCHHSQRSCKII